jgi:hypothetical protein
MTKTTKGLKKLADRVYLVHLHHDQTFIDWCYNRTGFVWNACVQGKYTHVEGKLHRALPNGELCPRFRNQNEVTGYRPNLSTKYRKVVSTNREALERWAKNVGNPTTPCGSCKPY